TYQSSGMFTGLTANSYTVTVMDAIQCTFDVPVTITQPASALSGSITGQTDVSCFGGSDGSVTVAGSGGAGSYEYSLDGAPYQPSGTFSSLTANSYTVSVRDNNLCTYNVPVTITQPPTAVSGSISSQANVSCFGGSDGSVTVTGSGGTTPYEYSLDGAPYQSSGTFSDLTANTYTVTVRDASLCTFDVPVTITQPASALSGSIFSQTNVACFGESTGIVTITGTGGIFPYEYSLDGGVYQSSGSFSGLSAANYTVTIRDANFCTYDVPVTITQPPSAVSGSITSQTDVACYGGSDGSVTITGSGGTGPYEYSLDGGSYQISGTFNGLSASDYIITVRDVNLCTYDIPVTLTQPATAVAGSISSQTNVTCNGGSDGDVTVSGSGGTGPYEYSLDGGSYQASGTFTNLAAKSYTITVRDVNLCTYPIPVTINEPSAISITGEVVTHISCNGANDGAITISASGGTGTFTYTLTPGGISNATGIFSGLSANVYSVSITDSDGCGPTISNNLTIINPPVISIISETAYDITCNGTNDGRIEITAAGGTSPYRYSINGGLSFLDNGGIFTGLGANAYDIVVRDTNNCEKTGSTLTINEPAVITMTADTTKPTCNYGTSDGSIRFIINGGTPAYEYSIDNGFTYQSDSSFTGLDAGIYDVVIKDNNNCLHSETVTLEAKINVIANTGADTSICPGDSITLTASGGDSYLWESTGFIPDPTSPNPTVNPDVITSYILTAYRSLCSDTDTVTISLFSVLGIDAGNDTTVQGGGSVVLTATGGFASYLWQPSTYLDRTDAASVTSTPEDDIMYYVTGTTTDGCLETDSVNVYIAQKIIIPSGFTPNNDGVNDTWEITNSYLYPSMTVDVFTRWGAKIFHAKGYNSSNFWDGTNNGKDLPIGTYYFVIYLHDPFGSKPVTGPVTIIR
ncbi:MAG: gliding motility-associated C-terminal domain-containing protein, partial [Bacteroidales bacterium]